jgi:hypothetical protein
MRSSGVRWIANTYPQNRALLIGFARAVLAAAPAQPAEPVAWMSPASDSMIGKTDENGSAYHIITTSKKTANNAVPLYTHPPRRAWQGLTEEEIYPLYSEPSSDAEMVEFARAIEAALRSKNYE